MANILLVDDSETSRRSLAHILEAAQHHLAEAGDGAEALVCARSEHPDLIISDILMPTMDGYEFVHRMRLDPLLAHTPVLFCTAHYRDAEARSLACACGVAGMIGKNASPQEILQAVEDALTLPRPQVSVALPEHFEHAHRQLLTDKLYETHSEAELRFRDVVEGCMQGIMIRTDERIHFANRACAEMFGYDSPAEIVGKPWHNLVAPEELPIHRARGEACLRGESLPPLPNWQGVRKDGARIWLESVARPFQLEGRPAILGFVTDVTERKGAEQRANAQHALTRILAAASSVAEAWQQILPALGEALEWEVGGLWRADAANGVLRCQYLWHDPTFTPGDFEVVTRATAFASGIGMPGRVWQARAPLWIADVVKESNFPRARQAAQAGLHGGMCFPIVLGSEVLGVFEFFTMRVMPLDRALLKKMASIASQIAQFIERKQAEAELHNTGDLLRAVAAGTTDAVFVKDRAGRYLLFNPAAARFVGRTVEEVLGKDDTELFDLESARRIMEQDRQVMETGQAATLEERLTAAGVTRTYLATKAPYRDDNAAVVGLIGISRDITDRKEAEAALRAAEHRLRHVISSSPAVLYTRAVEGNFLCGITWISDNLRDVMGYRAEQVTDRNWWLAQIHPEDRDWVLACTQRDLFGEGRVANEYRFRHHDGAYRWVRNEMRLVCDAADQAIEVVGSFSEITERKQLEDQFRQAQKMEAVGRLAGGVAHDFNNLLTVIIGYSEVLRAGAAADDPNRLFIDEIGKAGERAASLTRQLLAFSRKQLLVPIVLDLRALVKDMQKMLTRLIGEDLQLEFDLPQAALNINADPGQMEQVIMNLVVNSRDAMPRGGKLTVATAEVELDAAYAQTHPGIQPGPYAAILVTDTGCGMDAATQAHIFEPFFTTKGPEKGTGLGLATVFGIVKQSGGCIDVSSALGTGTTFTILLPRVGEELHQHKARSSHDDGSRRGDETVLLAEDDDGIRALMRFILEGNGYKVLDASNGLQALEICTKHQGPIDILASDVVMPNMSGPELARQAGALRRAMKVLYLSGYTDDAVVRYGMIDADTPYLQKPFTPQALLAKVREVLDTAQPVAAMTI